MVTAAGPESDHLRSDDVLTEHNDDRLLSIYGVVYGIGIAVWSLLIVAAAGAGIALSSWTALIISVALAGLLARVIAQRLREFRSLRHLPGPRPSMFLGNMRALFRYGHGDRERALVEMHDSYGPMVRIHLAWGTRPFVSLSYASANLASRELDSLRRADRTVLPRSLMGIESGEDHRDHRQVILPSLSQRSVLNRSYVLQRVSAQVVDGWKGDNGSHDGLQADIQDWSVNALSAFLFGDDWDDSVDLVGYRRALSTIEEEVSFRAFHPFFVRYLFRHRSTRVRKAYRDVAQVMESVTRRRIVRAPDGCLAQDRPKDMLERLRNASSPGRGMPWTSKDAIEEMMSLTLGGADPMAYVIGQALVLLSRDPQVQQRARDAVLAEQQVGTGSPRCPAGGDAEGGSDDLLRHVVYETLRLFPPVPFSAKVTGDHPIHEMGTTIPPGTTMMWMKNAVGRNPEVFDRPESFDPGRFERDSESGDHDSLSQFLPFGAGPRKCVGNRLAEQQCVLMLEQILQNFRIEPVENVDVRFHSTISVVPSAIPVRLVSIR
jgi:cytochrome P450